MCSTFIKYFVHSGNIVATEEMFDISAFLLSVPNKKWKLCLVVCAYLIKAKNAILIVTEILILVSQKHFDYASQYLSHRKEWEWNLDLDDKLQKSDGLSLESDKICKNKDVLNFQSFCLFSKSNTSMLTPSLSSLLFLSQWNVR